MDGRREKMIRKVFINNKLVYMINKVMNIIMVTKTVSTFYYKTIGTEVFGILTFRRSFSQTLFQIWL